MPMTMKQNKEASFRAALQAVGLEVPPAGRAHHAAPGDLPATAVIEQWDKTRLRPDDNQPRRDLGDIEEHRASLEAHGVLRALLVDPDGLIVYGERTWRAAMLSETLRTLPVVVRQVNAQERLEIQLTENIQRKGLSEVEFYSGCARLMEEFRLTNDAVARRMVRSASSISRGVRVVRNEELMFSINHDKLTFAAAMDLVDRLPKGKHHEPSKVAEATRTLLASVPSDGRVTSSKVRANVATNGEKLRTANMASKALAAQTQAQLQLPTATSLPPTEVGRQALAAARDANAALHEAYLKYKLVQSVLALGTPEAKQVKELLHALEAGRGNVNNVYDVHSEVEAEIKPRLRMVG